MQPRGNKDSDIALIATLVNNGAKITELSRYLDLAQFRPDNQLSKDDIALLNTYIDNGCTPSQIKSMFELVTGKSQNSQLQTKFN